MDSRSPVPAPAAASLRERVVDLARQWPWIYPRGIAGSAQAWVQRSQQQLGWYGGLRSDWYEEIHPGGVSVYPHPEGLSAAARTAFDQVASRRYPAASVCFLSGAHLVGREGLVLTRDNRVLSEYYHQFGTRPLARTILSRPFALTHTRVQRIKEPVALLAAPQGWNYYHWVSDVLPRWHLLERWHGVIGQYAVPDNLSPIQLESLQLLGISRDRLLFLSANQRLRCQHLYVPSLPGSEGCSPPWVLPFLQEKFLPAAALFHGPAERIYLARGPQAARPVLNEDQLMARLERRGFRRIVADGLSFPEQVALFRDARLVIAAHGAGLTNLAFARRIGVLELLSADYPRADCYFTLSRQAGHPYDCWLDEARAAPDKPWGAITVDLDAVERKIDALERALAQPHATS
jgi:hypothetical protein